MIYNKQLTLIGNTIFTLSGATLTFTTAPSNDIKIFVQAGSNDQLLLDGTDSSSTNAGHQILTEDGLDFEQEDTHTTIIDGETNDRIVLEFDTFENLGVSSESGSIQRFHILKEWCWLYITTNCYNINYHRYRCKTSCSNR